MANDVITKAYGTRLGNLTAKSVLVLLADEANNSGFCWPGVETIAAKTEIGVRTVLRILQVFHTIDLVERTTHINQAGKIVVAFQIRLHKLGTDQSQAFDAAYAEAQGKKGEAVSTECRSDISADVAETQNSVAATLGSVAATFPPHPHNGGTLSDPLGTQLPLTPSRGEGEMRPDVTGPATDQVCSALGIANQRKGQLIRCVIALAAEKGEHPATVALAIIAAVREQADLHARRLLKFQFGLSRFLGEGIWRDKNRWAWDNEEARLQAEVSIGSKR